MTTTTTTTTMMMVVRRSMNKTTTTTTVTVTVTVNWDTCIALPSRRPRAHHRVNLYPGVRRQNETEMFSDYDETSQSIAAVSAPSAACSVLATQQQKRLCRWRWPRPLLISSSSSSSSSLRSRQLMQRHQVPSSRWILCPCSSSSTAGNNRTRETAASVDARRHRQCA